MSSSKVIIVAAGRGRRLGPETEDIPKCMVRVAGQPILHWQLRAFAAAGLSDIVVVRGYLVDNFGFDDSQFRTLGTGKQTDEASDAGWGAVRILIYPVGTEIVPNLPVRGPVATTPKPQPFGARENLPTPACQK